MEDKKKIIVIAGPTASGKTGLSIHLANRYNGEIISADSMQVYKKLDVGTAKATKEEQKKAKHHLIDILEPCEDYNVQKFTELANKKIEEILNKGKIPIIVGGTGLYIESLINGIKFTSEEKKDDSIKKELEEILKTKGKEHLYKMLEEIDPKYAKTVHMNNYVRVIRGIEIFKTTGKTMSFQLENSIPKEKPYNSFIIALTTKNRQTLYDKINLRVDMMINEGVLEEAKYVFDNKEVFKTSAAAIGYKEFFEYFTNDKTLEECTELLKQFSRNYAKRQLTWFNRMENINWIFTDEDNVLDVSNKMLDEFLKT